MPHLLCLPYEPHARALCVPHSMVRSSTNTSCSYSSVVPPVAPWWHIARPAPPPPQLQHALPPPLPGGRTLPVQQARIPVCLFSSPLGLYVYSWPASIPVGWASLHPPTAFLLPLPLPAATIVLGLSPRLEPSTRVLNQPAFTARGAYSTLHQLSGED